MPPVRSERPLFDLKHGAVAAHGSRSRPAPARRTKRLRADAPEEKLGEPLEGHAAAEERGEATPEVSEMAPDAAAHDERPNEAETTRKRRQ